MNDPVNELSFELDFDSEEFITNPYRFYHQLRDETPVYQSPQGGWYLSRYDDVKMMMTDRSLVRKRPGFVTWIKTDDEQPNEFQRLISKWMIFSDAPEHTQMRRALNPFFKADNINKLGKVIQEIVDVRIEKLKYRNIFDLVNDFAIPVTTQVACRLLDVPQEDFRQFISWSNTITRAFDSSRVIACGDFDSTLLEIKNYFKSLYKNKKSFNKNSVASLWRQKNSPFTEEELLANVIGLLWAGNETTWMSISSAMLCLLEQPQVLRELHGNSDLIEMAFEETLRLESPLHKTGRWTTQDICFSDTVIPKGNYVVGLIGAANRDPDQFQNPDDLDLQRNVMSHMTFSFGEHHCLGARLGRLEGTLVIKSLLKHFPDMQLMNEKQIWRKFDGLRGLESLPVRVS